MKRSQTLSKLVLTFFLIILTAGSVGAVGPLQLDFVNSDLWTYYNDLSATDSLLYAVSDYGLITYNVVDPSNPVVLAQVNISDKKPIALATDQNYAYILTEDSCLMIYDLTDQTNPSYLSTLSSIGDAREIKLDGDYAFVAVRDYGLKVFDLSDRSAPVYLTGYENSDYPYQVELYGGFAYLLTDAGLQIYDKSNLDSLMFQGELPVYLAEGAMTYADYHIFLGDQESVYSIDVTDPTNPVEDDQYYLGGMGFYGTEIVVVGDYIVTNVDYEVYIINKSNPLALSSVTTYNADGYVASIETSGSNAFLATDFGFEIVDLTTPASPQRIFNYSIGDVNEVTADGNNLYVSTFMGGATLIDITGPEDHSVLGDLNSISTVTGVTIDGNYAYICAVAGGMQIIDITDPLSPTTVGSYNTDGYVVGITVEGNYAYVADGPKGIKIFDITDKANPALIGSYDSTFNNYSYNTIVDGNYLYASNGYEGFVILDISDKTTPTIVSYVNTAGNCHDLEKVGNYLYVCDGNTGFYIYNASNPASVYVLDSYNTDINFIIDVDIDGQFAYIADASKGVKILNVINPTNITLETSYDTPSYAEAIEYINGYLYVADMRGLLILKVVDLSLGVEDPISTVLPESFRLKQNYPNPFNPTTQIEFSLPSKDFVTLKVYDILGRNLRTLVEQNLSAGEYRVEWDGSDNYGNQVASGVYFYRLESGRQIDTKKMVMIK